MAMYIITHKKIEYSVPQGYFKLFVGAKNKEINLKGYFRDDVGENISSKNSSYCELTGLYWLWKNCKDDYIGLCHYRRFFRNSSLSFTDNKYYLYLEALFIRGSIRPIPIKEERLQFFLKKYDWVVPQLMIVKEKSLLSQYNKYHNFDDILKVKRILEVRFPDYVNSFDYIMNGNALSPYNMFFTKRSYLDEYCSWLFPILSELESDINVKDYDTYQGRVFGFIGERLLNVWLDYNKKRFKIKRIMVVNTNYFSRENIINKLKKRL